MKRTSILLVVAATVFMSSATDAQVLYAVSLRSYSDPGFTGIEGNLYTVDPGRATTTLVASLSLGGKTPVGLDGLATHPQTGVFYGITAPSSNVIPRSLVTVDPKTGITTLVGALGHTGSDIAFDQDGTLFVWLPDTGQVGTIDLVTGAVSPRGRPRQAGELKGGFTVIERGRGLVAASGGAGTLDSVDTTTGEITKGPALVGALYPDLINGLAFSSKGVLFAINTNFGASSLANLVTIDINTGKVTTIGPMPNDTDALNFGPAAAGPQELTVNLMQWRVPLLISLCILAFVVVIVAMRSKSR
jgi:hypothetical protein